MFPQFKIKHQDTVLISQARNMVSWHEIGMLAWKDLYLYRQAPLRIYADKTKLKANPWHWETAKAEQQQSSASSTHRGQSRRPGRCWAGLCPGCRRSAAAARGRTASWQQRRYRDSWHVTLLSRCHAAHLGTPTQSLVTPPLLVVHQNLLPVAW